VIKNHKASLLAYWRKLAGLVWREN